MINRTAVYTRKVDDLQQAHWHYVQSMVFVAIMIAGSLCRYYFAPTLTARKIACALEGVVNVVDQVVEVGTNTFQGKMPAVAEVALKLPVGIWL